MEFNTALFKHLSTFSGLTELIGDRVYPDELSQPPVYPSIVYEQSGEDEVETFVTPASNMIGPIYQFDCIGSTRAEAKAVAKQLRLAFKNFSGVMGGSGGVVVSGVEKLSQIDFREKNSDGKAINYRTMMEFQIWYQE